MHCVYNKHIYMHMLKVINVQCKFEILLEGVSCKLVTATTVQ